MTDDFLKNLEKLKNTRLSAEEKSQIRHILVSRMEFDRQIPQRSNTINLPLIGRIKYMPVFLIIALMIAGGAGTSVAASNAMPGDALYEFKIKVNERVAAALAVSAEADGEVAVDQAESRLEETEKLSAEGKLRAEVLAQLEERFSAHVTRVRAKIAELEGRGRDEKAARLAANFETTLRVHDAILTRLNAKLDVKAEADNVGEVRQKVEKRLTDDKIRVEAAAIGKIRSASNKITEAERYIAHVKVKADLSAEALAEAEAKLALAKTELAEAKAQLEADKFAEAFASAAKAHRLAQEAKLMVIARVELKIEVRVDDDRDDADRSEVKSETKVDSETKADVNTDQDDDDDEDRNELKLDTNARVEIKVR